MSIQLRNITKSYGDGTSCAQVLCGINLEVKNKEMTAIIGKSGAGKSTLLHIIGCLDHPTSGEYELDGSLVSSTDNRKRAWLRNHKFGFVMQDFGLVKDESVYHNIALPMLLGDGKYSRINDRVEELLKLLEIGHLRDRLVENLSGGEKQRIAIARALANDPDYILADEPTGALDSKTSDVIMSVFEQLHQKGKTVIIVTHDMEVAGRCQRICQIKDGRWV